MEESLTDAQLKRAIFAYQDLIDQFNARVSSAAEKIGGNVFEAS